MPTRAVNLRKSAQIINRLHNEVEALEESKREKAERIGQELIKVKEGLEHGKFLPWLEKNCPEVGERNAQQYMAFARGDTDKHYVPRTSKSEGTSDLPDDKDGDDEAGEPSPKKSWYIHDALSDTNLLIWKLRHNIRHHYKLPLSKKNAQGVLKSLERMEEEIKLIKEEVQNGWDE